MGGKRSFSEILWRGLSNAWPRLGGMVLLLKFKMVIEWVIGDLWA